MFDRLTSELSKAVQDPASDPRLIAIVASIALLLFLAFVVVVFLLLPKASDGQDGDEPGDAPQDEEAYVAPPEEESDSTAPVGQPAEPKRAWEARGVLGIVMIIVLIALILGAAGYADHAVQRDEFCPRCHVLETAVASAEATPHSVASCVACHRSPGLFGGLDLRLRMVSDLIANPTTVSIDKPAVVTDGGCRDCHRTELEDTLTVGVVRVRHSDFRKKVACASCHGAVGHSLEPTAPRPALRMAVCMSCHDGEQAPRECSECHLSDVAFTNAAVTFGKIDLPPPTTCRGCHDIAPCTACHGVEMPHPENWSDPKVHAKLGAFDRSKTCDLCHEAGCSPCHSQALHTNHGSDWKTVHATVKTSAGCLGCHDEAKVGSDMCKLCH